jgi:uncharacterized coiled-coil protein SlyX
MWGLPAAIVFAAGCALRGDIEVLESELRRQEQAQEELNEQLTSAREELRVARSDADALRTQLAQRGQVSLASEQAEVLYRAEGIKFNMLLTSGMDRDGQPGDEAISVLLLPVDQHGDLVKLIGAVEFELHDLAQTGDQQRLGVWHYTVDQVRDHWHRGFLSAGYLFHLDWQTPPVSPELTLHARMIAPDGRRFEATTQLKVTLPGATPLAQNRHRSARPTGAVTPASHSRPAAPAAPSSSSEPAAEAGNGKAGPQITPRPAERPGHSRIEETSDRYQEHTLPNWR